LGETLQSGRKAVHYPEHSVPHNTSLTQDWDCDQKLRSCLPDGMTWRHSGRTTNC